MFSSPVKATCSILASVLPSSSHIGATAPLSTKILGEKNITQNEKSHQSTERFTMKSMLDWLIDRLNPPSEKLPHGDDFRVGECTHWICSGVPPDRALVMAHAASFRVLKSALASMSIRIGMIPASITNCNPKKRKTNSRVLCRRKSDWIRGNKTEMTHTWICWRLPAVMLDRVQHASLRMASLTSGRVSNTFRGSNTPLFSTVCVWMSSPVTILPTARRAADTTFCASFLLTEEKPTSLEFNIHSIDWLIDWSTKPTPKVPPVAGTHQHRSRPGSCRSARRRDRKWPSRNRSGRQRRYGTKVGPAPAMRLSPIIIPLLQRLDIIGKKQKLPPTIFWKITFIKKRWVVEISGKETNNRKSGWRITFAKSGWGFLPRQRLERAQTAFRIIDKRLERVKILWWKNRMKNDRPWNSKRRTCGNSAPPPSSTYVTSGPKIPSFKTRSRHSVLSPAIFPKAQTA